MNIHIDMHMDRKQTAVNVRTKVSNVPLIERTYDVMLPNGKMEKVNVFDMNLKIVCGYLHKYIQLESGGWIRVGSLKILKGGRQIWPTP